MMLAVVTGVLLVAVGALLHAWLASWCSALVLEVEIPSAVKQELTALRHELLEELSQHGKRLADDRKLLLDEAFGGVLSVQRTLMEDCKRLAQSRQLEQDGFTRECEGACWTTSVCPCGKGGMCGRVDTSSVRPCWNGAT